MNTLTTEHRNKDGKTPTSVWVLRNPLDFIAEDHLRLRTMCAELDRLAASPRGEAPALADLKEYLSHELPLLLADEDDELMPRVHARAEPEDELPKLAARLHQEHTKIIQHLGPVLSGLETFALTQTMPNDLHDGFRALANVIRRHLILENAVLLPLSRARLTADDLNGLMVAMLKRRGLHNIFVK